MALSLQATASSWSRRQDLDPAILISRIEHEPTGASLRLNTQPKMLVIDRTRQIAPLEPEGNLQVDALVAPDAKW
jgi:hypothetical protein